jgi:hypothetical protein
MPPGAVESVMAGMKAPVIPNIKHPYPIGFKNAQHLSPMKHTLRQKITCILAASLLAPGALYLHAEETVATASDEDLAMQLVNPVASLISLPLQNNFDWGAGPDGDGFQYRINIQPVIPFELNEHWNLISRTILPYIYQENIFGTTSQSGISDTLQSLFFSPKAPTSGGWIWGVGPAFLLPTASDGLLGTEKWGAGPTAVFLRQENGWTYGMLANHIGSFAGEDSRQEVSATFLQPFLTYTTGMHTTFSINTESSYDWENSQWTVPINVGVSQLLKIGGSPIQFQLGGRYYAETPDNGPDWGLRFTVTFLWPR